MSNALTFFECCGLRSTQRDSDEPAKCMITNLLTIRVERGNESDRNNLSGYQASDLSEVGGNLVHSKQGYQTNINNTLY